MALCPDEESRISAVDAFFIADFSHHYSVEVDLAPHYKARALDTVLIGVDLLDCLFIWQSFLFPRLVILGLRAFEGRVGHHIPCVADANEQEQHRYRSDDEQGRYRLTREHNRRNEQGGIGDERQDRVP